MEHLAASCLLQTKNLVAIRFLELKVVEEILLGDLIHGQPFLAGD